MSKIGLYDVDDTGFPNYALMCLSSYYPNSEIYLPILHDAYDKVYASSVFQFSDKSYVTDDMIKGGVGFGMYDSLPNKISKCRPNYSIYSQCNYSIIWFDMGCFRKCPFCIVHKLGKHREVNRLCINPKGKYIKVQDDQFFYGDWQRKIKWLKEQKQKVEIQNVDARTISSKQCVALNELKHNSQIKFAWDNPKDDLTDVFKEIIKIIPAYKIMVYVLIGYWSTTEQDYDRVMKLRKLKIDSFVMPFDKKNNYQKRFARWVNHKAIFKSVNWENYGISEGKG